MLMLVFMKFNNRRIGGCMVVDIYSWTSCQPYGDLHKRGYLNLDSSYNTTECNIYMTITKNKEAPHVIC